MFAAEQFESLSRGFQDWVIVEQLLFVDLMSTVDKLAVSGFF